MVVIPTGFVLTTGNSRYGWYVPWGDGMAAHIHREFIDAYCHDHISSVGMALREAKIATAPWVTVEGENGCLRWNIYCLNALGDGALCPWFEEPFNPNVIYEQGMMAGTSSTTVHVSHFDSPLPDFQVSLFNGETLLGRAITNANGDATLTFDPALTAGTMQLIVTGQSAWPQVLEVNGFVSGEAYVYGDLLDLSGESINGNQLFVSGNLYNKGNVAANDVIPRVTSECEYITAHESGGGGFVLEPNDTYYLEHIGSFEIANNIPDQTVFTLDLTTYVGNVMHTTHKEFIASAPNMEFSDFVIDDSMGDGNGFADPGEQITLNISGKNSGHAIASDAYLTINCDRSEIHLETETIQLGDIAANDNFIANLGIYSDNATPSGTIAHLDITLSTGEYSTTYNYVLTIGIIAESFESGDFSFIEWEHSGDTPWYITDEDAHSGTRCARSGAIDDNQVSNLIIYADILEDSEINFWLKTSSEYHKDYLAFFIDNKVKQWWSGETDWTYASVSIPSGSHEFKWAYDKNQHNSSGSDCAWIDDITFPRTCLVTGVEETVTMKQNAVYPNPNNGNFTLQLVDESNVIISNLMGQHVMSLNKVSGLQSIQLEKAGMYLIQIYNSTNVETLKVVVE